MTVVIINPGTGQVTYRRISDGDDGRFGFALEHAGRRVDIDMPGLELDRVRYVNEPGQNAWHFPRLYVDGSSWLWEFAVSMARSTLDGTFDK